MLELLLCSLLTIFPDYLYRRYVQGKRLGEEINFYSVWFELRWGITSCLILTVSLITVIFYNHPSTNNATLLYRTVPILPEINGRVAEVYIGVNDPISKGAPIFRLDSSKQEAAVESARRKIAEIEAETSVAQTEIVKTEGQIQEAKSARQQTFDELETKRELQRRNPGNVAFRDIQKLEVNLAGREGAITAATAAKQEAEERIATLLPAQKASAEAALAQAQVELQKTVIRAGVDGRVEQFALRAGDMVNPMARSAGNPDPHRCWSALRRLRADRIAGHEGWNDSRGRLCIQTLERYPDGGDGCAGLYCRRPIPWRRAIARSATGHAAGHPSRGTRAALRRWARWCDGWQQLHRKRLLQQPRQNRGKRDWRRETRYSSCSRCACARARLRFCGSRLSCILSRTSCSADIDRAASARVIRNIPRRAFGETDLRLHSRSNRERNRAKAAIPTAAIVRGSNGSTRDLSGSSLD